MKCLYRILFLMLLSIGTFIHAQTVVVQVKSRELNLPEPQIKFILPAKTWNETNQKMSSTVHKYPSLVVFKSPVKHTAFFCRMEDVTRKNFGVMIQVHAGDYNSYMDKKIER